MTDLNGPEFVGTPEYMAPEMIIGKPGATFSADLWTVGVILFQVRLIRAITLLPHVGVTLRHA